MLSFFVFLLVTAALAFLLRKEIKLTILLIEMALIHAVFILRLGIMALRDDLDLL